MDCENWLSAVPSLLTTMNDGLATIQFQSLSVNPDDPLGDLMGGTQDNGTWLFSGGPEWLETIDGDGGQSGYGAEDSDIRVHTYFDATPDVSFDAGVPGSWNWIGDPLQKSKEQRSFYVPLITDPVVGGAMFTGMESIWRTQNNGGPQAFLEENCNEYTGTFKHVCGDWKPIGSGTSGNLTSTFYGRDKLGHYVVATERSGGDTGTLWAGTRVGRVFVSKNANAPRQQVSYRRIDTPAQPERFVSGIAIDPTNSNHAFVSFSGYEAYTPGQPGHVFEVTFHPGTGHRDLDGHQCQHRRPAGHRRGVRRPDGRRLRVDGLQRPSARGRRQRVDRGGHGASAGRHVRPHDRHVGRGPGAVRGHARPRRLVGGAAIERRPRLGQAAGFVTVAANSSRLST